MKEIHLFTIGFTKKSAEMFFDILKNAHVKRIIDIRLNNMSQLSGFAKKDNLKYFLKTICDIEYLHIPMFAPTKDILDEYRKGSDWNLYVSKFSELIRNRKIEDVVDKEVLDHACLLCTEDTAQKCHRRLIAEYLKNQIGNIIITHL